MRTVCLPVACAIAAIALPTEADSAIFDVRFDGVVTGVEFRTTCAGGPCSTTNILFEQLPFATQLSGSFTNSLGPIEISEGQSVTLRINPSAPNGIPSITGTVTNNGGFLIGTNLGYTLNDCPDGFPTRSCSDFFAFASTFNAIGGIPEPGTWLMMLLGFGAIGFSMRKTRNVTARLAAA
jgi:hypothetical protein